MKYRRSSASRCGIWGESIPWHDIRGTRPTDRKPSNLMRLVLHSKVSSSAITIDIHLWIQTSIGVWPNSKSVA